VLGGALPIPQSLNHHRLLRDGREKIWARGRSWALPEAGRCDSEEARSRRSGWQRVGVPIAAPGSVAGSTNNQQLVLNLKAKP